MCACRGWLGTIVALCWATGRVESWKQWMYNSSTTLQWRAMWGHEHGPRGRSGHSMVLDGTRIILFGGRDDETFREHTPRTFDIEELDGARSFTTYESLPLYDCIKPANWSQGVNGTSAANGTYYGSCLNQVEVGVYYNDVWVYDLNCTRYADEPCVDNGWKVLHPGAINAECRILVGGREVCEIPSERYLHSAALFDDRTMLVYGGFSQRCEDYCDDLWSFDLRDNTWLEVYEVDHFKRGDSPGKRWRFSMLATGTTFLLFGGHRIWHGFAQENSYANRWSDYERFPPGGYLDDFWVFEKNMLAPEELVPLYTVGYGRWRQIKPSKRCFLSPGLTWADRNDVECEELWPSGRAGHAAALDESLNGMWMYGGYSTYFPYISTGSAGAGRGGAAAPSNTIVDFVAYPTAPFYLDDLWFYNFTSELWNKVEVRSRESPGPRCDHSLVLVNDILVLVGGYNDNLVYDDTWYFNISTSRWLQKSTFVHARFPPSCVDDVAYLTNPANNCTALLWAQPLDRNAFAPFDAKPWGAQTYYYPDPSGQPYWGILDKDSPLPPPGFPSSHVTPGTPLYPYAATGPRQWARSFVYRYNTSHNATLLQSCVSVRGEPTRWQTDQAAFLLSHSSSLSASYGHGAAATPPRVDVFIPQPRRQSPGWDGCRDRDDGRADLPNQLRWAHPSSRSQHQAVYSKDFELLVLYGGLGYDRDEAPTKAETYLTHALGDMWVFDINGCPRNCSNHGSCYMGFCFCDSGYYGVDCSNSSCPGDFCYYDTNTLAQVCVHCCSAGHTHHPNDSYVENARKVPCSLTEPGESHGICDGFGTCQCAPPFLGDDCAIRDCRDNCSFNGYCSVEYPVSRCLCFPGYFGDTCALKECLNNCTYPNGLCNHTTGQCDCRMSYVPYNNTRPYYPFYGEDCSWIVAFAAAPNSGLRSANVWLQVLFVGLFTVLLMRHYSQEEEGDR